MRKLLIMICMIPIMGMAQSFPTSNDEVLEEITQTTADNERVASLLYSHYVKLYKKYSSQRAKAYERIEDAQSFHLGRSTEQKLKDIDNAKRFYNEYNDLYQKALKSCDVYYNYLSIENPVSKTFFFGSHFLGVFFKYLFFIHIFGVQVLIFLHSK